MSTFCFVMSCSKDQDTIVGTSTSCSASCVSRTRARIGTSSDKILGTSITCSGSGKGMSRKCARFSNCPTICGAGSSRVSKGTGSTICCTVRRCARSCGLTSESRSGREPRRQAQHRRPWQSTLCLPPGEEDASGTPPCSATRDPPPRPWPSPGAVPLWCNFSARAIATDIRSCRNMERSRRSLLRRAEPVETRSAPEPSAGL